MVVFTTGENNGFKNKAKLILPYKISCIKGSLEIPLISLRVSVSGYGQDYLVCMIAPPSSAKLAPHIKLAITDGHLLRLLCYLWSLEHFCLLLLLLGHPPLSATSINIFEAFIVVLKS